MFFGQFFSRLLQSKHMLKKTWDCPGAFKFIVGSSLLASQDLLIIKAPILDVNCVHATESNDVDHDYKEEDIFLRRRTIKSIFPPSMQAAVSVKCQLECLLRMMSYLKFVIRRWSVWAKGIMRVLAGSLSTITSRAYLVEPYLYQSMASLHIPLMLSSTWYTHKPARHTQCESINSITPHT